MKKRIVYIEEYKFYSLYYGIGVRLITFANYVHCFQMKTSILDILKNFKPKGGKDC